MYRILLILFFLNLQVSAQTAGDLDFSFNGSGKIIIDYSDLDHCEDVVIDSFNNTIFAGYTTTFGTITNTDFLVGKLNSSGIIDSSFGVNGFYTGDFPKANASFIHNIKPLSDGFLLFGSGLKYGIADTQYIYVQKINLNGLLDTAFADSGTFAGVFLGSYNYAGSIAIQNDGKIVVCGSAYDSVTVQDVPLIGRLYSNGQPDTTFSPSGFKYWDLTGPLQDADNVFANMPEHGAGGFLDDVLILENGNIFFSGFYDSGTTIHCLMLMLNSDGNFESSFAFGGYHIFQNNPSYSNKIVKSILFRDQIMLGIHLDGASTNDFLIQPIDTLGNFGTIFTTDFSGQRDVLKDIQIINDRLFLAGYSTLQSNIAPGYFSDYFTLAKYDSVGFINTQFSNSGQLLEDFNLNDETGSNCLYGRNNKIVLGGYVNNISGNNVTDFGFMRIYNSTTNSINETKYTNEISVFPNPATNMIAIKNAKGIQDVTFYNAMGQMFSVNSIEKLSNEIHYDISHLSSGIYLVEILDNNSNKEIIKIMVQ